MGCFDPSTSQTISESKTAGQKKVLDKAATLYGGELGQGANIFPGQRVAPLSASTQSVFDFAEGGGFITGPEATESYFQGAVRAPAMKSLREDVIPGVREAYSGPGYWSSARAEAESRATEDTVADLNQQRAVLDWQTQQANKQGALAQLGVGGVEQGYNQQVINAEIQKFAEQNAITDPQNLAVLLSILGIGAPSSQGESQGPGLGYAYLPAMASGGAGAAAAAGGGG